jgi:Cu-Zn family superoxide dismutase
MPNIHVPEDGKLRIEVLNQMVFLSDGLFDDDGSAIVIHAGPDDYVSDPAGDAGARIACGVVTK